MRKILLTSLFYLFCNNFVYSQVGVGVTTPNGALDVTSTTDGLLIPRIALSATNIATVVTPTVSELVYNTNTSVAGPNQVTPGYYFWNGSLWVRLNNSNFWSLNGNTSITSPANPVTYGTSSIGSTENYIGTTDANDVVLGTNNTERLRVLRTTGRVGVGVASPQQALSVGNGLNLDQNNLNSGSLTNGLTFGSSSISGIASNRIGALNPLGLDFYQNNINRMRLWNDGRVSIGTRFDGTMNPNAVLSVLEGTSADVDVQVFSARKGGAAGSRWEMGSVEFYTEGYANIGFSSNVCPRDSNTSWNLGSAWNTNYDGFAWYNLYVVNAPIITSDITLKEEIKPITYGLETVRNIETISYKLKNEKYPDGKICSPEDKETFIGFNAQQLRKLIPEVVKYKDYLTVDEVNYKKVKTPTYGVRYDGVIPVAINAIKDLDKQHQDLIKIINITDFGVESDNTNKITVLFTEEFKSKLQGKPVVTITSLDGNVNLQLKSVTANGFVVENLSNTNETSFNWIAIAKIKENSLAIDSNFNQAEHEAKVAKMMADENSLDTVQSVLDLRSQKGKK